SLCLQIFLIGSQPDIILGNILLTDNRYDTEGFIAILAGYAIRHCLNSAYIFDRNIPLDGAGRYIHILDGFRGDKVKGNILIDINLLEVFLMECSVISLS